MKLRSFGFKQGESLLPTALPRLDFPHILITVIRVILDVGEDVAYVDLWESDAFGKIGLHMCCVFSQCMKYSVVPSLHCPVSRE